MNIEENPFSTFFYLAAANTRRHIPLQILFVSTGSFCSMNAGQTVGGGPIQYWSLLNVSLAF
jgi:hypothetical protein